MTASPAPGQGGAEVPPPSPSPYSGGPLIARFEEMAAAYPDNDAVTDGAQRVSYRDLDAWASLLGGEIVRRVGAGPEPVALLLGHNVRAVIALVAALKAGRPYLELRLNDPPQRMQALLKDSRAVMLVGSRVLLAELDALRGHPGAPEHSLVFEDVDLSAAQPRPGMRVPPEAPFCVMYTSGTTGVPKGVQRSHGSILTSARANIALDDHGAAGRHAVLAPVGSAAAHAQLVVPLLSGGTVSLFDFAASGPAKTLDWIDSEGVTWMRATPSVFRRIFEAAAPGRILSSLRRVHLGGERVQRLDFERFRAHTPPACVFTNVLASSEAGFISMLELSHDAVVTGEYLSVGIPPSRIEVWLVDDEGRGVPEGEAGEIVVRSASAARPTHEAQRRHDGRFQTDAQDPDRTIVFTGDMGRFLPNGELEFLGRKDTQVKVRGHRVEPSEVEEALLALPQVREGVVVARPSRVHADQQELAAYVVLREPIADARIVLRRALAARLPDYAVPAHIVPLKSMPIGATGKVDLRALPEVAERDEVADEDLPNGAVEQQIAALWSSILKQEHIGARDDFFELGGDSLSVLNMMLEVERQQGRPVPRAFLGEPTIRNLAALLAAPPSDEGAAQPAFELEPRRKQAASSRLRNPFRLLASGLRSAYVFARESLFEEGSYMVWWLGRATASQTLAQAVERVQRLSVQERLTRILLWRKRRLFRRYLLSIGLQGDEAAKVFHRNVATNLLFHVFGAGRLFRHGGTSVFEADRGALLESAPLDVLAQRCLVNGMPLLEEARSRGRGVILLSFHGTAWGRFARRALSRFLSDAPIQAIALRMAENQTEYRGRRDLMPDAVAGSLYAELGVHAQTLLRQGGLLHMNNDTSGHGPGRRYDLDLGDRRHSIRAGFAELAINTGAAVLPIYARFLEDGSLQIEIQPAFTVPRGTREQQVLALVAQYGDFINVALKQHPEMMLWKKMRHHLRRPKIPAG